ncbi:MAG: DUF1553 domain-containing protein [Verrucomicrobia bacterium]|nr:DUF1553 domain-containing protein [Verrucomicrobiota bacterium]
MRLNPWPFKFLLVCFIADTAGTWADAADTTDPQPELSREAQEFFQQQIRPILAESCYQCHSAEAKKLKGGLRLDFRDGVLRGGDTGPAIVPGEPEKSLLIKAVRYADKDLQMPPKQMLLPEQITNLEAWVKMGAPDPRRESDAAVVRPGGEQQGGRKFWSAQPLRQPQTPKVKKSSWPRTAVDHFVLNKLEEKHLPPSREASRQILIRRVSFDLIGLPPTPQEVTDFLNDKSPGAFERVVERLLASPHYGERWGRHWLDAAGYADSNGYFNADSDRPLAYKYRDYVVRSINEDKPFDRFIQEQIAGDELANYQPDGDITPEMVDLLTATHFLRNAPDGTGESDGNPLELKVDRYSVLEGNVQILGSAFLGVTVQCARCHDHKFEPVTQQEYYQLQAILRSAFDPEQWRKPNERVLTVGTRAAREENKHRLEKYEREIKTLKESLEGLVAPFRKLAVQENLEKIPEPARTSLQKAFDTKEKERTEEMKALLKTNAAIVEIKDEDLAKRFAELSAGYESLQAGIKKRESEKPVALPQIAVLTEAANKPSAHRLLLRGVYSNEGREVSPGVPAVFCSGKNSYQPVAANGQHTSGRRLALARWLTSPENPVVARVLVNRVWQHHFGEGLVATVDNLGVTGAKPTNPELLDYLAAEFVRSGWRLKTLHRLIVNSATYRQSGALRNAPYALDPDNKLLWRFPMQRLDAESVRDAILLASGELNLEIGGAYVPTRANSDGQIVIDETNVGAKRRSLYLQQRRTQPVTMLQVFDTAQMNPNCTRRNPSTVSLQSLASLNSDFIRARSRAFAQRLEKDCGADGKQRLERTFLLALGRKPGPAERSAAEEFLQAQTNHYVDKPDKNERVWADFCQMVLAGNAFLYVE